MYSKEVIKHFKNPKNMGFYERSRWGWRNWQSTMWRYS